MEEYQRLLATAEISIEALTKILSAPQAVVDSLDERLTNVSSRELQKNFNGDELNLLSKSPFSQDATVADLQKLLEEAQKQADDSAIEVPVKPIADRHASLDFMSGNFRILNRAKREFEDNGIGGISDDSITGINNAFEGLDISDFEVFLEILSSASSTAEDVENAFSSLADGYIYTSDCLNTLTDATASQTIQDLEGMGVTNASQIVMSSLAVQKALAAEQSGELTNSLYSEIAAIIQEYDITGNAQQYLYQYALQKAIANGVTLQTDGDIANMIDLVNGCGESVIAIEKFAEVRRIALLGLMPTAEDLSNPFQADMDRKKEYQAYLDAKAEAEEAIRKAASGIGGGNTKNGTTPPKIPNGSSSKNSAPKAPPRDTTKSFNWIETALKRIKEAFDRLKAVASATYRLFSERNSALSQEFANLRQQIEMNQNAYAVYMAKADAVGLSHEYQAKVQNGSISIEDIKDESLQKQIEEYKKYYESAMDCADAVEELRNQLSKLAKEKFDLVSSEYSNQLSLIEMDSKRIQDNIDETETRGHMVSTKYYEKLIALEQKNLELLKQKRAAMQAALDEAVASNDVPVGSEDWYKMRQEIDDVDQAIRDSNTSLLEFNNNIRDLQWERFDQLQENISHITDEADFLISLFDDKELFDEQGNRNENGKAVAGLHAVNYNTHMQQSDDYGKEIAAIDQQLQADPYNQELIKRRYELVEAQRESIQAAQQEKQAIRDLVEQGINAQLDSMQKLIDKRREALNAEKELYDYQKSVEQKTKAVTDIQKQLDAYQGDDSEETKAKLQKLRVSLDSAKTDLEETEYDKYISDQEQLLDSLYTEYEEILNARLDNIDSLLSDIITEVNASSGVIGAAITQAAADSGVKLSDGMKAIWDSSIYPVVAPYNELFSTTLTTVSNTITTIKDFMQQMINKSDQDAQQQTGVPNASDPQPQAPADTPAPPADPGPSAPGFPWISKKDNFPKNRLDTENSIVDRLKLHDFDSSMSARSTYYAAMGGSGHYSGTDSQNIFMLNWMKQNGYKRGVRDILKKQLAWTQEDGRELIYRSSDGAMLTPLQTGDKVFTRQMSDNLWTLAQKNPVTPNILSAAVLPAVDNLAGITSSLTPVSNDISMEVVLPNVTSYKEFKTELVKDRQFEQAMQDAIIGKALGKNNLQKYSRI